MENKGINLTGLLEDHTILEQNYTETQLQENEDQKSEFQSVFQDSLFTEISLRESPQHKTILLQ